MKTRLAVSLFYLLILLLWQYTASQNWIPRYIFPTPMMVIGRLRDMGNDGILWPSIRETLIRMAAGFFLAAVIGLTLGLLMGTSRLINSCFRSILLGLQTLPSAAWVPISLLIFGLQDKGIYFVIIMSSTAAMAIATADGILQIQPLYLRAARTLGTPWYATGYSVIFPAALPNIVTGIKLGWTLGWHGAVSAELIKSTMGLGFLLHMGRELNDAAQVLGIMLLTILIGLVLDKFFFGLIESRIKQQWGLISPE
jgi:NitT/TauT family transport system permease protein